MQIEQTLIVGVISAVAVWAYVRWRSPRPEYPPLETSPDDPLMIAALDKARGSLDRFMTLARAPHDNALVKLRFVSNSQQVEHLWAELVQVLSDDALEVRLVTPPVTHTGHLDRLWRCKLDDLEDWQVRDAEGKIHGGYSQRAMFAIARREGVQLPKGLLEQEAIYRDIE
jgi:uncharacterized protein YegJ (DUF2314 family)